MNDLPLVLVTGATGKQGGATIRSLLAAGRTRVRAMTRDPGSRSATRLAATGVEVVRGDFDDAASLRRALEGVQAAFSVQTFEGRGGVEAEERQGRAMAEAVRDSGAHLVYASVDGAERNSGVPHFESKAAVERHIERLGLPATILRPAAFMENLEAGGVPRAMFLGMLRTVIGNERPLQWVSVEDVGHFAARALERPERFSGRAIAIAGDELTVPQLLQTYRDVTGAAPWLPPIPGLLPRLMLPRDIALMLEWFREHGFEADIEGRRQEHPELRTFEAWLSAHAPRAAAQGA